MQDGELCPLKDKESRVVPILDALLPILKAWHLRTGGVGPLLKPKHPRRGGRPDLGRPATFIRPHTLNERVAEMLENCGLEARAPDDSDEPRLNWYRWTRHPFASHWVLDGRSMERLRLILGREDLTTTMRYAHLAPDSFSAADPGGGLRRPDMPAGKVIALASPAGADKVAPRSGAGMGTAARGSAKGAA